LALSQTAATATTAIDVTSFKLDLTRFFLPQFRILIFLGGKKPLSYFSSIRQQLRATLCGNNLSAWPTRLN